MFDMDDKENETQPENKGANKLAVEPSGQKPRRSVLKEFDPFAPDSPCQPKLKVKNSAVPPIDEDEIFEDAETSLTSYVCRNKNIGNSPSTKITNGTHESSIVPDLRDNCPEEILNLNDTFDMSYVEAIENLSQAELDKTSSKKDLEFNCKTQMKPEILVNNKLLDITDDIDRNNDVNEDNIMVDSLERTFDCSSPPNFTRVNIPFSVVLNKTEPVEVKENPTIVKRSISKEPNKTEPIVDIEFSEMHPKERDSMVDSLESPSPVENVPVLDNTFEINQYNLIDSLEIVKPKDNLKDLNAEEIPLTIKVENVEIQAQNETMVIENECRVSGSSVTLDTTFDLSTDADKPETSISASYKSDAYIAPVGALETVEIGNQNTTLHPKVSSDNANLHTTFETQSSNAVEFIADQLQSDYCYDTGHLNETIEISFSDPVEVETDEVNTSNVEPKTCDSQSLNTDTPFNVSSTLENAANGDYTSLVEKGAYIENKTFDSDENKTPIEENSSAMAKLVDHETERPQKEDSKSDSASLEKTLDTLSDTSNISTSDNRDNKLITTETDKISSEVADKLAKNVEQKSTLEERLDSHFHTTDIATPETLENKITFEIDKTSSKVLDKVEENAVELEPILEKIVDTPSLSTDNITLPENLEKIVKATETDKLSSEVTAKVGKNVEEQEPIQLELIATQSATNVSRIVENHSVSLKEIIGKDSPVQDNVNPKNIDPAALEVPSFSANNSEVNLTFNADEDAVESSRVMEVLAQSLNQTIDVEESAIADDINSSKSAETSGDLSKEGLNVTIENVKEDTSTPADVSGVINEEHRKNKHLDRKETEEFEHLEMRYDENTQNAEKCAKEAIDSLEAVIKTFGDEKVDTAAEEKFSRVFLRQDTCEFEALERECNEGTQNINYCDQKETVEYVPINDVKQEKPNEDENETKVIKRQETQEFEDLEREYTANSETPKECLDSKLKETMPSFDVAEPVESSNRFKAIVNETIKEEIARKETDLPIKPVEVPVKVKVSGNICSASSSVEIDTETTIKEPFTGIQLKYEQHTTKQESVDGITPIPTEITINGFDDGISKKTDELIEKSQISTFVKNDPVPAPSENIAKPKNRPVCRPTIRSIHNKTEVNEKPDIINETGDHHTSPVSNELNEEERNLSQVKSEELKTEIKRLQAEIELNKTEIKRKDKYVLTCALDLEAERDNVIKYKKVMEDYAQTILKQTEDLKRLKEEEETKTKSFTSLEMAFADVFEKYEKAKSVIVQYSKNEEILKHNLQCAEDQLTKLEAKCSVIKEKYSEKLRLVEEQMMQEKEKYRQEMAKLQAMVKRLEIKSSSLETALKQKTEECRALAALCDDITGNQM